MKGLNRVYNIIALCGKSSVGKDTLLSALVKKTGWNKIVSCTTRPKRDYEVEGKDYYFLNNDQFYDKIVSNEMLEAAVFNDWCYGTQVSSLKENEINVGVFNPEGIETLREDKRINLLAVQLECPDKIRLIRQLNREQNPDIDEVFRRYKADREDFIDFKADIVLDNVYKRDFDKNIKAIQNKVKDWWLLF